MVELRANAENPGVVESSVAGPFRLPRYHRRLSLHHCDAGRDRRLVDDSVLIRTEELTRTAADAALMLQAIAAYDLQDVASQKFPPVYYPSAIEEGIAAVRIGVARDFWNEVDEEIVSAVDAAVTALGQITAGVQDVELSTDTDRTLVRCEAYAYHQKYLPQHENSYEPETLRRIRSGMP